MERVVIMKIEQRELFSVNSVLPAGVEIVITVNAEDFLMQKPNRPLRLFGLLQALREECQRLQYTEEDVAHTIKHSALYGDHHKPDGWV